MAPEYTLRPALPDDEDFLLRLYSVSRPDVEILATWPDAERDALLRSQFDLQRHHYETSYPNSRHDIVVLGDVAVGRVWVDWQDEEARGLDIAILPEHRRQGLGGRIMEDLKAQAARRGVPFTLCVEHMNAGAKRFYERHGCRDLKDIGSHMMMEWSASASEESSG